MAQGKKTSPEDIYKVMVSWAVTGSYMETARQLGMPESTVEKIVKTNRDKDEFVKLCAEKKEDFSKSATRIIEMALKRLEKELDSEGVNIPINHLTTAIGTLYDKRALAQGSATENVEVKIVLPEGAEEYAE
jgi:hypothetical protein